MNKTAIQKFAVWARNELIGQVSQRAYQYGIDETNCDASLEAVGGRLLSAEEKAQRRELVRQIEAKGYTQVMEEVAYTWFNRFIALRFMEVNNYLPSHIRVFSDGNGAFKPEILSDALHVDLPGLDSAKVAEYIEENDTEALYRYLLLTQCNALNEALPMMFERMGGYTEMLLPNNILKPDGVLGRMVADIPEDDWRDAVQIIGWLYQYYNTELNELVYDGSMSKSKIPKELLPAATTIYTPHWAIRYMVENSLGRLWLEGHPNDALKADWKYYLDDAEQETEVQAQLEKLRAEYRSIKPEEIKVIDPCMGSGHILVYAFDVLMQIYEAQGVTQREAAQSILQNNLYGLDIDQRAAQMAYFAVMMKARQYDRRFLTRGIQPNLYHPGSDEEGRELGSILQIDALEPMPEQTKDLFDTEYDEALMQWNFRRLLAQKYDVVVTNPPYLGSSRFSQVLSKYVLNNYPDVKSDLSMVMYKHALQDLCKKNGFVSFITTTSWMFLSSFAKLRSYIFANYDFESIVDFGTELFDGKVGHNPIVAWVTRKSRIDHAMTGIRLVDYCYSRRDEKQKEFFSKSNYHYPKQSNFSKIPGSPVAYWVSEKFMQIFQKGKKLNEYAVVFEGLKTRDKERFLRFWFEVNTSKWKHYAKGGAFRRWYGNGEYVVDWGSNGDEVRAFKKSSGANFKNYFTPTITYSALTSYKFSARFIDNQIFGGGGGGITEVTHLNYILAFINSCVFHYLINAISPTLNFEVGQIGMQPIIFDECQKNDVLSRVDDNIQISKQDWDSYETSWDFKKSPLV